MNHNSTDSGILTRFSPFGYRSRYCGWLALPVRWHDANECSAGRCACLRVPCPTSSRRKGSSDFGLVPRAGGDDRKGNRQEDALAAKQLAALERLRQIKAMLLEHLDKEAWATLLDRAQAAAAEGESSFELMRFPCDLCSDGGRKSALPKMTGRRP